MSKFTIAAQLYTLRDFLQTEGDIESTLHRVSEMGFKSVQISGMGEIDADKLKKILDDCGLTVCCTHTPYDRLKNDLENVIAEHKTIGCDVVGLGMMPNDLRFTEQGYVEFCEFANETQKKLNAAGLSFAYHNHNFEFTKYNGKTGFDIIIENTDIGFIPDVFWLQAGGVNPPVYLDKIGSRIKCCHLKDMAIYDFGQRFSALGEGNIDFVPILKTLEKHNVEYLAIEQDDCYGLDPFECLKTSLNYINKLIKTI